MNWVDGVVLAVLVLSAIVALFRGLVQEVLGIGAWVGAALVALALRPCLPRRSFKRSRRPGLPTPSPSRASSSRFWSS